MSQAMKILVLADARSFHTERYVAELRRQGCEVMLASLEGGEEPAKDVPNINGGVQRECQDHKGPDLQEKKIQWQEPKGSCPTRRQVEWTPDQVRGDKDGASRQMWTSAAHGVRLRRRFAVRTVAYTLAAGEVERLIGEWKPDVISAHYAAGYGYLASRLRRRGIPITLHVWGSDVLIVPKKSWLHKMKVVKGIRAADYVFADSRFLADATTALAGERPMAVYPWGIERRFLVLHKANYRMGRPLRIIVPRLHEAVYANAFIVEALQEEIRQGVVRVTFPAFGSGYAGFVKQLGELGLGVREVARQMWIAAGDAEGPTINGGLPEYGQTGLSVPHECQDHKGPDLQEEKGMDSGLRRGDSVDGSSNRDGGNPQQAVGYSGEEGVVYCYAKLGREGFLRMMAGHDVYLSAAKSDSSPVTLIEAMALGLVPVAADIPGVREWLTDESGFRYTPGDAEGLRRIIYRLAERGARWAGEGSTGERPDEEGFEAERSREERVDRDRVDWERVEGEGIKAERFARERLDEMRERNRERVEREGIFEDNVAAQVAVMRRLVGEREGLRGEK